MYQVLKNRLLEGGYALVDGQARIDYFVASGGITVEQAAELGVIAREKANLPSALELMLAEINARIEELRRLTAGPEA